MKPGDLIAAKYRLERVIGDGSMGEVWAAINESTRGPVAIKLIGDSSPVLRTRMLREARAGGSLRHRNIVNVYDVGETDRGDPFLVMELLSGETLADRLRRVPQLSPAAAIGIAVSIAHALRAAHAKGIIHRDLKPANVFLHHEVDVDGEVVKVLDFGVCKRLDDSARSVAGGPVGSPAYMSPEQARAEANVDARSDLWSFGVVLFEMLAGRRPFPNASPYSVIAEVLTAPIPSIAALVPEVSPVLASVVERCLTRDVAARVASAEELVGLLRPFHAAAAASADDPVNAGDGVQAPPIPPPPPAPDELTTKYQAKAFSLTAPPPTVVLTLDMGAEEVTTAMRLAVPPDTERLPPVPLVAPTPAPIVAHRGPPLVALGLGGLVLAALVVLGVTLGRKSPPPDGASQVTTTTAAEPVTAPPTPDGTAAPSTTPAAGPDPNEAPRRRDEARIVIDSPDGTLVSLDGRLVGAAPMAPVTVGPGAHRISFRHALLGQRVVLVQAKAGETSVAAPAFDARPPQTSRSRNKAVQGEKRPVFP